MKFDTEDPSLVVVVNLVVVIVVVVLVNVVVVTLFVVTDHIEVNKC